MSVRPCLGIVAAVCASWVVLACGCSPRPEEPAAPATAPGGSDPQQAASGIPSSAPAAGQPATGESVCKAALAWFDKALASDVVASLVPAAELAAEKFIADGTLLAAGNEGFCDEMYYRAGGFPFTAIWADLPTGRNDVLLIGQYRPDGEDLPYGLDEAKRRKSSFGEGLIVHLAGHDWPAVASLVRRIRKDAPDERLFLIDTGAPAGEGLEAVCVGQLATTALAWAFHGEVISAATRKGKTLATWASDWEPDGPEWDDSVRGCHLHPQYRVPPIPAGQLGRRYLKICRDMTEQFARTQPGQVRLAGARLAKALKAGGSVYVLTNGHIHARGSLVPSRLRRVINCGREGSWRRISHQLSAEDMLLWMGYLRYPREPVEEALSRGAGAVTVSVDPGVNDEKRTHVLSCWKDFDTVIDLPRYPIRVLPASGTVQTPQWYALMAETLAAYERAGLPKEP